MKFARVRWSTAAETRLRRAMKYADDAAFIRGEVLSGAAQLWSIDDGASFMVVRAEGIECVIVCYEGERLCEAAPEIIAAAKRGGFRYIRWHTQSPSLNRMLRFLNPEPLEYVVRISTNGQQVEKLNVCEPDDDKHTRH